ncbi:MAG TPA: glycosyltransferase [Candidatus Peribacterales bacterium]|nr:glycosyltransferase [Candidatus Peribacterales bacterium]
MKLLIITQVVDKNYVPLCFAVEWFREFGKQCDQVTIISQKVGKYDLPKNVNVLSLKKEEGKSKCMQVMRFYRLVWKHRKEYEAVFVHMTPIWVVFGAPLWLLFRKRVYLWYEARGTGWNVRLGLAFVRKAFSASLGGMPLQTKKSVLTGHGIDTVFFASPQLSSSDRDPNLIVTVGRITKAKRIDLIIQCFAALPPQYRLQIIGVPITEEDYKTRAMLEALVETLGIGDRIVFETISDEELRILLQRAMLFLHASEATSLDKAPLQAMASECLVVTASPVVKPHVPELCRAEPKTMADASKKILAMPSLEQEKLRKELRIIVEQKHSLQLLIRTLVKEMES